MENFIEDLRWRGFLHTFTPNVKKHLAENRVTGYIGFDPSAASLHVGSLLPIMGLVHLQRSGHTPVAIAGGGTGMVGDPSGKTQERKLLTAEELAANLEGIKKQLAQFLDFKTEKNPAKLVNNAEWLTRLSLMDFLRDIGKHFSVNEMLAKDSVKSRIGQEQGMSFTEFTYSLLQSYDYLELYDRYQCTLQMGGSDQWGNIVSGVDLIRRLRGAEVHAIVFPLITTSAGVKFGKTEGGTIWLDPGRTSPYRFYQYWLNTDDRDVIQYLKFFTLLSQDRIRALEESLQKNPEKREAHAALGQEVTRSVHGDSALAQAIKASKIFFGGEIADVSESELLDIFSDVPSMELPRNQFGGDGSPFLDLMISATVARSKGEARRLVEGGGMYLNNRKITDVARKVRVDEAIHGKFLVLRRGGKNYFLVRLLS